MATNSTHSLHHHRHQQLPSHCRHQQFPSHPPPPSTAFFLKPTTPKPSLSSTTTTGTYSLSLTSAYSSITGIVGAAATTSTSELATALDTLHDHLSARDYRRADDETRRLLIALAGEAAVKRGYVFFSEVQFIPEFDLKAINSLWMEHSDGKFGYSVQKKIWEKANRDFSKFFIKVGWMKKLDTEVEQYNYRSFPAEFMWEMTNETPEGHLPLTNALRGTQLLSCILSHPAFEDMEDEVAAEEKEDGGDGSKSRESGSQPLSKRLFKPNYSF